MSKAITKKMFCLLVYGGIEIWVEEDVAEKLNTLLQDENVKWIPRGDGKRGINKSHCVGIFSPEEMETENRKKMGMVKCKYENWHVKNEICQCGQQIAAEETRKNYLDLPDQRPNGHKNDSFTGLTPLPVDSELAAAAVHRQDW